MKKTTANEKRIARVQEKNRQRIESTTASIEKSISRESVVNLKARETMRAYIEHGSHSDIFGRAVIELASIITHCKLNLLNDKDTTGRKDFEQMKIGVTLNGKVNQYIDILSDLYVETHNTNGDKVVKCTDSKRAEKVWSEIVNTANNKGGDLVSDCYTELLRCLQHLTKDGEEPTEDLLLKPFKTYIPGSQYNRKSGEKKPQELWSQKMTNAVKESGSAVRKSVERERAVRDTDGVYISDTVSVWDEISGDEVEKQIYKKCYFVEESFDFNGKPFTITGDREVEEYFYKYIPTVANLTALEIEAFIGFYFDGKSAEELAEKRNISTRKMKERLSLTRRKIVECVEFSGKEYARVENLPTEHSSQAVRMYQYGDETKATITTFDSIGQASKVLNIDKSIIAKVVKGERKQTANLVFEKI